MPKKYIAILLQTHLTHQQLSTKVQCRCFYQRGQYKSSEDFGALSDRMAKDEGAQVLPALLPGPCECRPSGSLIMRAPVENSFVNKAYIATFCT